MKLVCSRDALAEALAVAGSVVVSRTPAPVLCLKLEAKDGLLTVSATDTEIGLVLGVAEVDIREEGSALIPADKLNQIVRASGDDALTIEVDKNVAGIKGKDREVQGLRLRSRRSSPGTPTFEEGEAEFESNAGILPPPIGRTVFATAVENSRYAINGVLLERKGRHLRMVATDGRRLAVARGECSTNAEEDASSIIPTKALNVLSRLMSDPDEPVRVRRDHNQILFQVGDGPAAPMLSSNLVEGSFPPFEDVIPKDQDKRVEFDSGDLSSAVRRAALLTNEESKGVRLAFADGTLTAVEPGPRDGRGGDQGRAVRLPGRSDRDRVQPGVSDRGPEARRRRTVLIEPGRAEQAGRRHQGRVATSPTW